MKYRNKVTGAVIISSSKINCKNWELVEAPSASVSIQEDSPSSEEVKPSRRKRKKES